MGRARAASGDESKIVHVETPSCADLGDQISHMGVDGLDDRVSRAFDGHLKLLGEQRHGLARLAGVQPDVAAEEVVGRDVAKNDVGISDRGLHVALAVARRTGIGAGALGPDAEQAERVDRRDAAAARADAARVDHLDRDAMLADPALGCRRHLAAPDRAHLEARPAHVDRDQLVADSGLGEVERRGGSRRRTRGEQIDGAGANLLGGLNQSIGQHHHQAAAEALRGEPLDETVEVVGDERRDVCADGGRAEALELAPDGQDLVRRAHAPPAKYLLADLRCPLFVRRVDERVEEAHRDRHDTVGLQLLGGAPHGVLVERRQHLAGIAHSLGHADPPPPRHERLVRRHEDVEHRHLEITQPAPHLDHIPEILRRDHAGRSATTR